QQVVEQMRIGGVPPERCHLIYSTVDLDSVVSSQSRTELRAEMGLADDDLLLLAVGRLDHRKGFDVLIEALGQLKSRKLKPTLYIAGAGPERAKLEALVKTCGLEDQVHMLGQIPHSGRVLQATDIAVMPSRAEGLGIAGLEAMAAGKPLVASRVGGLKEIVDEGVSGVLVSPEDPVALANALASLLENPSLRCEMGVQGPLRVEALFSPKKMVDDYIALYRDVLNGEA
ncbi:MAG: glycosyltransferase family 4 protein, partial [Methylococcales bacterium]|nr:glycosyltransferase family 4 protein [Methylococcales bacterium]